MANNTAACKDVAQQGTSGANPVLGFNAVVQILVIVISAMAIIMLSVVSGFRFVVSNGDANTVKGSVAVLSTP